MLNFDCIASLDKNEIKRVELPNGNHLIVEHDFSDGEWGYNIELFDNENNLLNSWGYSNISDLESAWNCLKHEIV